MLKYVESGQTEILIWLLTRVFKNCSSLSFTKLNVLLITLHAYTERSNQSN